MLINVLSVALEYVHGVLYKGELGIGPNYIVIHVIENIYLRLLVK